MSDQAFLIREISIDKIKRAQFQTRKNFDDQAICELAHSIQEVGLLQPPVVKELSDGLYELIAGERRLTALTKIGHTTVRAFIKKASLDTSAKATLIENLQRVDLNPIEIAEGLFKLIEEFDYTQAQLAKCIGKKRSTIANYLRLLTLPNEIQQAVRKGSISMAHAKLLVSLPAEKQLSLFKKIVYESLSVQKTLKLSIDEEKQPSACFYSEIKDLLEQKLGTKVEITSRGKEGLLCLSFYGDDDLERLLELLSFHHKGT